MANPYTPPKSEVSDIQSESDEFQPINLWSARGRIGRLRYLAYSTGAALVFSAVISAFMFILGPSLGTIFTVIGYIALLVFTVLMAIQRSHDMNWSGWTILLSIIPLVGFIWVFKSGTKGENEYGFPPPPNTTGVKILGLVMPLVFVVGVLAAIAIPAYQGYVKRAQMMQHQE